MQGLGLGIGFGSVPMVARASAALENLVPGFDEAGWTNLSGASTGILPRSFMNTSTLTKGLHRSDLVTIGETYRLVISGMAGAQIWFGLSGGSSQKFTADGTYDVTLTQDAFFVRADALAAVSFDELSLYAL